MIKTPWGKGALGRLSIWRLRFCILALGVLAVIGGCESSTVPAAAGSQGENTGQSALDGLKGRALQIIEDALGDSEPQVRANAAEVVAETRQITLMPKVQRLLTDRVVPVRFAATVAAGDTKFAAAAQDIDILLSDPDENVKIAAAYAKYKLGSPSYLQVIRNALKNRDSRQTSLRANAAYLTGKAGDRAALQLLYQAMNDEKTDDKVRLNAVEAIARLGDETIYNKLWAMLISGYADVRFSGTRAMGALGTAQARESLMTMLDDDMMEIRLVAAAQLGSLADSSGERVVLEALTKPGDAADKEGRNRIDMLAALAIGKIGTGPLTRHLPRLMQHEAKVVRVAAARAVLERGKGQ